MVAPYLDMGADSPGNLYHAISHAGLRYFSAGFVIGRGCTSTWDDNVPVAKDPAVNHVITKAASLGAQVVVSFGGQAGEDLARSCRNSRRALAGYEAVVRRFGLTYVDFDIEGDALGEPASINARFSIIRKLEAKFPRLVVSLTVPVEPNGLDAQGRSLMRRAKVDRARIDLVNLMAMDFGGGSRDMGSAAISAVTAALAQLRKIGPGWSYAKLGITPMLGTNDDVRETFTLAEATRVAGFARSHGVGRLAFWALGRDGQCATKHVKPQYNCSGVAQAPLAFTRAFVG
jgi:chitinase